MEDGEGDDIQLNQATLDAIISGIAMRLEESRRPRERADPPQDEATGGKLGNIIANKAC